VRIVDEILSRPEFEDAPPVLIDIGASAQIHRKWKPIAKHSVAVAFEGHASEVPPRSDEFRELHVYGAVVAERAARESFYLTTFPFCSSRLRPRLDRLRPYALAPLFEVERVAEVQTVALPAVLAELGLERVDWFKTDSQGTDLRLFESLPEAQAAGVLVAEFEPGIVDAYEGEDTLADVMRELPRKGFWMSELTVRGSQRADSGLLREKLLPLQRRHLGVGLKPAPCWAEVEYFNELEDESLFDRRELLLACAFALIREQDGFAVEVARRGGARFDEPLFDRVEAAALQRIRRRFLKLPLAALSALPRLRGGA
jgi:hypothetical protein